ncbi:MAG: hypothetical protein KKA67_10785 [Spirochaetes bacterium]|nr:hypothetical protein [Spirochaetota bacterium]MBU1080689.1 hypothetical protein [Spirochaetota bacterium]
MRRADIAGTLAGIVVAILSCAVVAPVLLPDVPWPEAARDLLAARGLGETGASNLVSAIYLGYRAFDTLGETIVLLAALAGAVSLIGAARDTPLHGEEAGVAADRGDYRGPADKRRRLHTEIMDSIAGKLAPIVLLFGAYVMLYGHSSPGGGFQGGVVIASGVIFIAIGRRSGGIGRIGPRLTVFGPRALSRMEASAFAAIVLLSFPVSISAFEGLRAGASAVGVSVPAVSYIVALNVSIGLKVGSGVALMCVMMLGGESE